MSNDMSGVYAATKGRGVSPILGTGIFCIIVPFILQAIGMNAPFIRSAGMVLGIILIVVGLIHQMLLN